ncbi:MAG: heme ABC exporter ATP-binding protein CcmA [Proteobacteria bacterium]|nr:heme ABC exporter ATP-binding protein CcmA [Pseudomonadota bacterium]
MISSLISQAAREEQMLTLDNLLVGREEKFHLAPLSLCILSGACIVLHGPNGSGKSTILKTLATLIQPQGGAILLGEVNIQQDLDEYRSLLCYISDTETIDPELSVIDNLLLWAEMASREPALAATIMGMGLNEVVDEPVFTLSRGVRRRVQLARLLLSNAVIWLLDEPFVHLDEKTAEYLANLIKMKCQNKGIVILSSHDALVKLPDPAVIKLEDYRS